MPLKGLVVMPPQPSTHLLDGGPGTQRIANRPILCHALDALAAAGIGSLAVVAPAYALDRIRECVEADQTDLEITYLAQHGRDDLLGALEAAGPFVGDDPAVVHLADGLLGQELDQLTTALAGDTPDLLLLLHHGLDDSERLSPATQRLLGVSELNGSRARLSLAGVCRFGPGALRSAAAAAATSPNGADLIRVAEHLAAEGRLLEAGFVRSWRRYAGNPLDLLELNRIVLDQQPLGSQLPDAGENRIEGRVIIHPTAEVTCSTILGPTIIGAHARVLHSYIGPYTSVGAGATIENAEVVRSIVSEGAQIMHIGGRIEGSTIGRRASIFRDFRLPHAMRLHVGEGVEVGLD